MSELCKFPTINAGELSEVIDEETEYGWKFGNIKISRHVLFNQCGKLLTRKKNQIKGSSIHNLLLKIFCITIRGLSIPLIYSEIMLFPRIHYKNVKTLIYPLNHHHVMLV